MKYNRSVYAKAGAIALALAAAGTASVAQARDNVFWSVGIQAAPGIALGVGNAPGYVQPAPVYYAPAPVYYAPEPVYYGPPVYRVGYYGPYYGPRVHWQRVHWKHQPDGHGRRG